MRIFFYKVLIFFIFIFIFYKLTIGATIREFEKQISFLKSKENVEFIKEKIRDEIRGLETKDRYINKEDAKLINILIDKIKKDLNAE